jgi:hypothetical protein
MLLNFIYFSCFIFLHPLYFSSTHIKYVPESKTLKVTAQIFTEDMEEIIYLSHKIRLNHPDKAKVDLYIDQYIKENLSITIDDKVRKDMKMTGRSYYHDAMLIDYEIKNVEMPKSISAKVTYLLELFPEQTNMVNFKINKISKSFPLKEHNTIAKLTL